MKRAWLVLAALWLHGCNTNHCEGLHDAPKPGLYEFRGGEHSPIASAVAEISAGKATIVYQMHDGSTEEVQYAIE